MSTPETTDEQLLSEVAAMWELADPPPVDLADGVLARLAAEDLEFELLVLVEGAELAGVRGAADGTTEEQEETGSWSLEYAGPDLRAYLRITRVEDHTRLDGWVVPARAMTVELRPEGGQAMRVDLDEFGRFAFDQVSPGAHRLAFVDDSPVDSPEESPEESRDGRPGARLRLTPPFWI